MSYYMEVSSCPTLPLSWVPNCPVPNCPVSKCPVPSCPVSSCPGFYRSTSIEYVIMLTLAGGTSEASEALHGGGTN